MDPQTYGQLIFDKAGKNIQWKKIGSSENGTGKPGPDMQRMDLDDFLTPYTKINSKWMKGLNVRQEVIKIL